MTLVHLGGGSAPELLRQQFRVTSTPEGERYAVWGTGEGATEALKLALDKPEAVEALVLESPALDPSLEDRLSEVEVRTLILFGTSDENSHTGGTYKEKMPSCSFILVYGAGRDIAGDRPEAFSSLVSDFLERGERFVVSARTSVIQP